jgi:hypothetical protein
MLAFWKLLVISKNKGDYVVGTTIIHKLNSSLACQLNGLGSTMIITSLVWINLGNNGCMEFDGVGATSLESNICW